ncbi:MAG: DUF2104 domain-containing protein, partial [Methanobrevibacter sp.]|nr:DUF2104 domain-containing protein [Methanobrevibacter sp.]
LISYKNHKEAFIINEIDTVSLIISIVAWTLLFNYSLIPIFTTITIAIALFLVALVLGMRPGYGRKETLIGIVVSAIIWLFSYLIL